MKGTHQFALQYLHGGVWQPIKPRWLESVRHVICDMRLQNKLDFSVGKAVPRRILHRVVGKENEIGVRWASGKQFKLGQIETVNAKAMKDILKL